MSNTDTLKQMIAVANEASNLHSKEIKELKSILKRILNRFDNYDNRFDINDRELLDEARRLSLE